MFAKAYCLLFVEVDMVLQWARAKEEIDLGKTMKGGSSAPNKKTKRLLNIPKLEDGKTITNMAHYGTTLPCVRHPTNTKLYKTLFELARMQTLQVVEMVMGSDGVSWTSLYGQHTMKCTRNVGCTCAHVGLQCPFAVQVANAL